MNEVLVLVLVAAVCHTNIHPPTPLPSQQSMMGTVVEEKSQMLAARDHAWQAGSVTDNRPWESSQKLLLVWPMVAGRGVM